MKIGIITFWDSQDNYGQLLQCFALQHYLRKEGHDPFLIRYKSQTKKKSIVERVLGLWKILSPAYLSAYIKLKQNQKNSLAFNKLNPRHFDTFRDIHISQSSSEYHSFEDLVNENWEDVDAFICGSDQIWSYSQIKDNINAFFLQFTPENIKTIAYAASFGRPQLPKDYEKTLPQLLKKFSSVGLREKTGVKLCKEAKRSDAMLVCDPTILINSDDYISTIVNKPIIQKKSIFIYLLNWETEFPFNEIKNYTTEKGLKINFFGSHGVENKNMFSFMNELTIPSWIESMASSKFVFTNSFHGTVMAIILKKSFISFPLSGSSAKMNDRINTLLARLGLETRIYSPDESIVKILNNPINWEDVNKKLSDFRFESELFLKQALSDN